MIEYFLTYSNPGRAVIQKPIIINQHETPAYLYHHLPRRKPQLATNQSLPCAINCYM
jgi:hypothetical protein